MKTTTLKRLQTDPESGVVQAFFETALTADGETFRQPWVAVQWPVASDTPVQVIDAAGNPVVTTRAALFAAVMSIAEAEFAAQTAPAPEPAPEPSP